MDFIDTIGRLGGVPFRALAVLAAVLTLGACDDSAPPVEIEGSGSVEGLVFFDVAEDGVFDPADGDEALAGIGVAVQNRGTGQTFSGGSTQSGSDGRFAVSGIPLGTHDLLIDTLTVPAGVSICQNPLRVTVNLDESTFQQVQGRPGCLITIAEAKEAPIGEFVIVAGVVTSYPGQIESSFAYIEEETGGLFLFAPSLVGQGIEIGDRIEVGGTTEIFSGQLELTDVELRELIEDFATPEPRLVTTADLAASGADTFDDLQNRFVRVEGVELLEAFSASGNEQNSTIDDGSGAVIIRVDDGVAPRGDLDSIFSAGACYNINGFAANFNGAGQIFPRSLDDVEEVPCN